MPVIPTSFRRRRGPYTDNDEPERARARGVSKLKQAYEQGGAYNDIDDRQPNAARDYEMMERLSRRRKVKFPDPSKPK